MLKCLGSDVFQIFWNICIEFLTEHQKGSNCFRVFFIFGLGFSVHTTVFSIGKKNLMLTYISEIVKKRFSLIKKITQFRRFFKKSTLKI